MAPNPAPLGDLRRLCALALGLLCAPACGAPNLVDRVDRYHAAVHAAVAEGAGRSAYPRGGRIYPRLRERRLGVRDHRIGLFDFVALQGCRLGELAGERNSPLGRVMVPSRRLVYEADVLAAGDACLPTLEEPRLGRLRGLLDEKRQELPIHLWNALWTDSELSSYLASEVPPEPGEVYATAVLVELAGRVRTPIRSADDAERIEDALADLRGAAAGGGILRALDEVTHHLEAVAALLESSAPAVCRGTAARLSKLFERQFLPIQSELARLQGQAFDTIDALADVFESSAAAVPEPASMRRYHMKWLSTDGEGALWSRYRRAASRHARAWAPTLQACGVLPTPPAA